ncbi:MAG: DUF835 domain-containing protein [Methanobacteriota archaeon]|nr:MAG: DUF835 domain-containing protein [Euryarchaeota archaeon]TLZ68564.1 MAG: DUF835 domain-containing protein [Euryarchaeota archaeon]
MTAGPSIAFVLAPGAILPIAALLVSAFLGAYVFGVNPRGSANRSVLLVMLAFVLWDLGESVQRSFATGVSPDVLLFWARFTWVAIALVPATLYHLALTYPTKSDWIRRPWAVALVYAPFVAWAYLISMTGLIIDGVSSNAFGPSAHVAPTYPYFAPVFGLWMFFGVALFVRSYWRVRKGPSRRMLGVVLGGLLLGTVPAAVTELLWPLLTASDTRVGLGSVYTLMWSIFIAYAVARYRYLVIEPVTEVQVTRAPRHRLEPGLNYLVLENGRSAAMGAFRDIVSATPGLCVTGLPPSRVAVRFGLERTPILWITAVANEGRTVRPNALDFELVHTVMKFLRENPGTAVLLDDLDYLAILAGFEAVARFLKRVTNQASASKGTVIVAAGVGTFLPDQLALLRGSTDRVLEIQEAIAPSTPGAEHVLMTINSQDAPVALPLVGARRGLLLTTEHPAKARLRYGDRFEIVWVTDQPEPGVPCVRPKALDTEGRRAIGNYAAAHAGMDIVLVGLEQLALYVDLRSWLPFVKDALDIASIHGCRLFLTVAPEALSPQELAMLARRFDTSVSQSMLKGSPPSGPTTAAPENRIPYREPSA